LGQGIGHEVIVQSPEVICRFMELVGFDFSLNREIVFLAPKGRFYVSPGWSDASHSEHRATLGQNEKAIINPEGVALVFASSKRSLGPPLRGSWGACRLPRVARTLAVARILFTLG